MSDLNRNELNLTSSPSDKFSSASSDLATRSSARSFISSQGGDFSGNESSEECFEKPGPFEASEEVLGIIGQYKFQIGNGLGRGSYGRVYLARDLSRSIDVACKIVDLDPDDCMDLGTYQPMKEPNVMSELNHPNIVALYKYFTLGTSLFMFMELAPLCVIDFMGEPIEEPLVKKWSRQLAEAVLYIHERGYCHHDIKCDNLLVDKDDNVKLCDFGYAEETVDYKGRPVMSTLRYGSSAYMPPEIYEDQPYCGRKFDSWSYGVTVYFMLHSKLPFDDRDQDTLAMVEDMKAERYEFEQGSELVRDFIGSLLKSNPEDRPDFSEELGEILDHPWLAKRRVAERTSRCIIA